MFTPQQAADLDALRAETELCTYVTMGWSARFDQLVLLEIPLGELTGNWALAMIYRLRKGELVAIGPCDRFNAQGPEGKAVIPIEYGSALIQAQFLPPYRFQIRRVGP